MTRFILISFGFLGWAFYEMSGGAEFDPSDIREARLAVLEEEKPASKQATPAPEQMPVVLDSAPKVMVDTDPPRRNSTDDSEVTRVSLNLTSLQSVLEPESDEGAAPGAVSQPSATAVPQNAPIITSSADTPAIIPSLIAPNDGLVIEASEPTEAEDIRTVSGNRVNVRGGPGTNFDVVASLVRGDEVIVLEDNGDGWVRFESVDGNTGGWLAEFLLAGG
ncbi:SH3 domain-containing protein [Marimonas sp. MJW-29]|uniref:SH3 domain-containing protein n=1 Tax=Sulfitobacter sediminis TaxID=3234186 RepID=A0ABV3RJ87_9RHOB